MLTKEEILTNSVDPDQMPQNATSDQGLHCLHSGITIKSTPDTPKVGNGLVQFARVEESTRHKRDNGAMSCMTLFVLLKLILQKHMRSHPVELDVWFLVGPFVCFHTSCVQTAKALVRLRSCAGSSEPSLVACVISTIISWAGSKG